MTRAHFTAVCVTGSLGCADRGHDGPKDGGRSGGMRVPKWIPAGRCPTTHGVTTVPDTPFLIVPQVSSEEREYIPIGWPEPPIIPSEKLRLLPDATPADFALLTAAMHMAWMRAVTGRLESRYMYSVGVVYNTFLLQPAFADADTSTLEGAAQAVLNARSAHPGATLADLYDPDLMPHNLRRAHHGLDRAVDRL